MWFHLTNSYNSDGQWPPTTKASPHFIYPFNYNYNFQNLLTAEMLLGGVDRSSLETDPVATLRAVFTMQQDLVLAKAAERLASGPEAEQADARLARELIERSRCVANIDPAEKILYPAEYEIRAEALIRARKLVGGVLVAGDK